MSPMAKPHCKKPALSAYDAPFVLKKRKTVPHEFVLEAIDSLSPWTRAMFGCVAVYIEDRMVLILRDKDDGSADNGVWLATSEEHHASLRGEFPNMRSIQLLGKKVTAWQNLGVETPDFEEAALRACELILAGDPRIGKVPARRRAPKPVAKRAGKPAGKSAGKRAKK